MELTVIRLPADDASDDKRLDGVLQSALDGVAHATVTDVSALPDLRGRRLLFAMALGAYGVNTAYLRLLARLRAAPDTLDGCVSALIVDGGGELYTKSAAAELALALNSAGSALPGRPLVEATGSLQNFRVQAKNLGTDLMGAYRAAVRELAERLASEAFPLREKPALLALHASSYHVSNTMQLWAQVKVRLKKSCTVEEIGLRNGAVSDCSGCPYTACLHFGEKGRCFYGGLMQDEVWPAVRRCDAVVLLCPNYNDALSANLTAFINRMTGLFRQTRFYDKAVFAIVVSGYSGGDIVARQVLDAMNMNKSFYLPPRFALIETANDPGEALMLSGVNARLDAFAARMRKSLCAPAAAENIAGGY
ncbi:MAG: NAD(P)H-dependent oxidoreductase [Ruminococcaceae bacterium]|nr:NAD(P)H-dependent oxidoreductase [Oscillospiraceae bacterium]